MVMEAVAVSEQMLRVGRERGRGGIQGLSSSVCERRQSGRGGRGGGGDMRGRKSSEGRGRRGVDGGGGEGRGGGGGGLTHARVEAPSVPHGVGRNGGWVLGTNHILLILRLRLGKVGDAGSQTAVVWVVCGGKTSENEGCLTSPFCGGKGGDLAAFINISWKKRKNCWYLLSLFCYHYQ